MLEQERLELEQERRQREVMDEQYECALCHAKFAFERMCFLDVRTASHIYTPLLVTNPVAELWPLLLSAVSRQARHGTRGREAWR